MAKATRAVHVGKFPKLMVKFQGPFGPTVKAAKQIKPTRYVK